MNGFSKDLSLTHTYLVKIGQVQGNSLWKKSLEMYFSPRERELDLNTWVMQIHPLCVYLHNDEKFSQFQLRPYTPSFGDTLSIKIPLTARPSILKVPQLFINLKFTTDYFQQHKQVWQLLCLPKFVSPRKIESILFVKNAFKVNKEVHFELSDDIFCTAECTAFIHFVLMASAKMVQSYRFALRRTWETVCTENRQRAENFRRKIKVLVH